jgi:hypothetical protein
MSTTFGAIGNHLFSGLLLATAAAEAPVADKRIAREESFMVTIGGDYRLLWVLGECFECAVSCSRGVDRGRLKKELKKQDGSGEDRLGLYLYTSDRLICELGEAPSAVSTSSSVKKNQPSVISSSTLIPPLRAEADIAGS